MDEYDICIVGGGFAGLYAAWRLARAGRRVALIEGADSLGGSLSSVPWRGFFVDNGAHNLDLRRPEGADFYQDILGSALQRIEGHTWGTAIPGGWTEGFEFPDLSHDPALCRAALEEMRALHESATLDPADEADDEPWITWYGKTRGPALTAAIAPMAAKFTGIGDISAVSVDAARTLSNFNRPRLGTDGDMAQLKRAAGFWDERLGVSLSCDDPAFVGASRPDSFGYPRHGGLRAFGAAAMQRLAELGVTLMLQARVTGIQPGARHVRLVVQGRGDVRAARVFWTLPRHLLAGVLGLGAGPDRGLVPVGVGLFAFEVDAADIVGPHYLHDYAPARLAFRYSSPGIYGGQINRDGRSYVVAEVPAHPAALPGLNGAEAEAECWKGLLQTGYLRRGAVAHATLRWALPVTFAVPRVGWRPEATRQADELAERAPRVESIDFGYRGRGAFMSFFDRALMPRLSSESP